MIFSAVFILLCLVPFAMSALRLLHEIQKEGFRIFWQKHWKKLPLLPIVASCLMIVCLLIRMVTPGPAVLLLYSFARLCVDVVCANKIILVYWGIALPEEETRLKRRVWCYHLVLGVALIVTIIENFSYASEMYRSEGFISHGKNPFWNAYMFLLRIAGAFVFGRAVKLVIKNRDYDTSGLWVVLKELKLCRSLSSRVEAVKASVALWGPCWLGLVRTGLEVYTIGYLVLSDDELLANPAAMACVAWLYMLVLGELTLWVAMPLFAKWQRNKRASKAILQLQREVVVAHEKQVEQSNVYVGERLRVTELKAIVLDYLDRDLAVTVRGVTLPSDVLRKLLRYEEL